MGEEEAYAQSQEKVTNPYRYGIKARQTVINWYQKVLEPISLTTPQIDTLVREIETALREGA